MADSRKRRVESDFGNQLQRWARLANKRAKPLTAALLVTENKVSQNSRENNPSRGWK